MAWRKIKTHFRQRWVWYVGGIFIVLTVIPLTILLFTVALPWVIYPRLDYYQKLGYLTQLSLVPFWSVISGGVFILGYYWLMFGGGFMKFSKSKIRRNRVNVRWDDVIGMEEAKLEAWEVVQLLKERALLKRIGGSILRGILLIGPPGCGKTYLAKAIATETGVPFLSISGSEFVEIFVGVGPSRVRKLFKQARQMAEADGGCIIFIDELDAVGQQRTQDLGFGARSEANNTVNQLLVELDGLTSKESNILVIGATNASERTLDQALLRPGRFDRKIYVDFPGLEDREKLFAYYLKKVQHEATIDVARLARRTVWKSPADVESIIKEAALIAARYKRELVTFKDLSEALERLELGFKHRRKLSEEERRRVAYHESGHLIAAYILHPTDDVFKASIISRRDALGVVYHQPREELYTSNRDRILANIKVALGGYASEKLTFGVTSDGVATDFRNAMAQASEMVWRFGMGTNGFIGDYTSLLESWAFRGTASGDRLSDQTKERLNQETHRILNECLHDVETLLKKEEALLHRFAQELLQKEELEYDEIEQIFVEAGKARPQRPPTTATAPPPTTTAS